jgi:hypothetical protein
MNANDSLNSCTCTDGYYATILPNFFHTSGVHELAEKFKCYWFVDIVVSYQLVPKITSEDFQVWTLKRTGDTAVVTCTDGNGKYLVSQDIEATSFEPDEATIWVEGKVALLPSEH